MSRKIKRNILRNKAKSMKVKESAYVHSAWRDKQEKKYGYKIAAVLELIGSCKGKTYQKRKLERNTLERAKEYLNFKKAR